MTKLLVDVGAACAEYQDRALRKTLRVTPAMEAGVSDDVWSLEEIAALVVEPVAKKGGPYKARA